MCVHSSHFCRYAYVCMCVSGGDVFIAAGAASKRRWTQRHPTFTPMSESSTAQPPSLDSWCYM